MGLLNSKPGRENALSVVNHPATRLHGPNLLHHLVQQTSKDGLPAIDFLGPDGRRISLSYPELQHASDVLAARISASVGPREKTKPLVVPVLIPQSPELYVALLAILKAGGAFCPMNLDVPLERAKFILDDASAEIVITTSELAARVTHGTHSVLVIDGEVPDEPPAATWHRQPTPSDLAYVMYTSGSTGTPKGVGVSHDAATQSLLAHDRHIPPFSRFLQFAAPTFDVSVFEIFFPFFRGQTLVGCARAAMLNDLPGVLRRMDVDACELTPSVAGSLLRRRDSAPGLRLLLTIGEMLTQPVVEEFGGSKDRSSMLWAMYGPTEAAIHCTLDPAAAHDATVRGIGIPLDTVSAFVLKIPDDDGGKDSEIEFLPRGEVGELAVGGHQLADGYLNRPEQTASAFIDTPYGRLYRTGDKAKMLPDGTLECLGRISDGQVKLRGQRLELGEVEHAALRTPGCHNAVAAVTSSTLVLFCAADGPANAMAASVMESCRQWLPGFMLPGDVVVVDSFPRLTSGKVDRKRLVAEYKARAGGAEPEVHCKDELEKRLHDLTSGFLGVNVLPSQDLAKAGLDSLSAIKLASIMRDADFDVGAVDILAARSVSGLASRLRASTTSGQAQEAADLAKFERSDIVADHPLLSAYSERVEVIIPCTPLQASMLAETMVDPRAYCNWVELSFRGRQTFEQIRSWFVQLAQANEALRSGFVHHDGQFLQVVFRAFDESNISVRDSADREFGLKADEDFVRPFRIQISAHSHDHDVRVVLQMHHAMYDGWSLDLLLKDLASLVQGQQPTARPQFRKVAGYYQSAAFKDGCDAAREFWAANLLGFQPPALPGLSSELVTAPTVQVSTFPLDIDPEVIKTTLRGIECSSQTVFQAALAWLWSSMVGSEDVVVGSIQSGRTMPISSIEDIIGPCIASVPLRTRLSQVRTVKDLVVSVHAGNRATLAHSILPLSEVKRAAGIRPGQACYDVAFVYQESLHSKDCKTGAVRQVGYQDYLETKLLVEVEPRDGDFELRFTYHSDAFPEAHIGIMAKSLKLLVTSMLENLEMDVLSLRRTFPQDLLSIYNPNPSTFEGVPDLAGAVARVAEKFPDKDALCFADHISDGVLTTTAITFDELNRTADRIAYHLDQKGVRTGGVVGIIMEKSISLYVGILAILKTGSAYLPLLPGTPASRIKTIFEQAGVEVCLVDSVTSAGLKTQLRCNLLDVQKLNLGSGPTLGVTPEPDPTRLAYVIYTSGSTGVPKGVCLTQLNVVSNLDVLSRIYPVKESSRLLQSCSQAFDVSVFEIFFAWTQGMCLCAATNDTLLEDLERSIRKLNVTHLSMTPTVASLVDPEKVPRVEFLVTAGEPMTELVAQKWGDKLYQGYGPSETTNICSVKKMGGNQVIRHLGWSFDNTSTYVLALDSMDPVPYGCLGEFCFGGDQVGQGYLDMDELTSAKFIEHPVFGRIYRSGDLGRMLPDGSMVIVGRADEQIKIRGQRVELNEITETIRQSTNAADCATLFLRGGRTGSQDQIVSYFVPCQHEGAGFQVLGVDDRLRVEVQTLYHVLESRLPAYMVPSFILPISTLPTTASGKLDRARLTQAFRGLSDDHVAAISHGTEQDVDGGEWSTTERRLAEVISHALDVQKNDIGRWTPLAAVGLDSLSAIQVSRHLHAELGTRLPISVILQNPSVARLAKALSDADDAASASQDETRGLVPQAVADRTKDRLQGLGKFFTNILPCTPLQEAMLASSTGRSQYLNCMLFRVSGDFVKLKHAWTAMVARHDILRTCFVATDDTRWPILQVVLAQWRPPWVEFELEGAQSSLDECISRHAEQVPNAIDSAEPAVSFATIRQGGKTYISFVCHHALYDGVGIEVLLREVEQHFSGSSLPPVPSYERFLRSSLSLPDDTEDFWHAQLDGYQPKLAVHLQFKFSESCHDEWTSLLDIPLSDIQGKVRELGVSMLAVMQSAWAIALGRLFGTDDVCFGNVVNGRSLPLEGIDDLVAPCFNTIPVRMDMSGRRRNLDLMRASQAANAELLKYQFTPLRRIQSLFTHHGSRRLFDTLLLLQQSPRPLDQSIWTLERDDGEMDVPLVCEVIPDGHFDRLTVKIHTTEDQPLPHGIVALIFDLFAFALKQCLQFPGSNAALDSLPQKLAERLAHVEYHPPQLSPTTAQQGPAAEEWTATERTVRTVLASLSSAAPSLIHRQTTIYQLGLDSISAVQIAAMLRKLGYEVLASDVIEHPTSESLARHIDNRLSPSTAPVAYDITKFQSGVESQVVAQGIPLDDVEAILPCTPLQSAMMAQFIKSGGRDYFNYVDFELGDGVSSASVAGAWRALSRVHAILRTAIVAVEHSDCAFAMVQYAESVLEPTVSFLHGKPTETFDLRAWQDEASRAAIEAPYTRLWHVVVVEGKAHATMHLAIHHSLYDAYSLQLVLGELSRAVTGRQLSPSTSPEQAVADILGSVSVAAEDSAEFWRTQADKVVINSFPIMTPLREASRRTMTKRTTSSVPLTSLEEAASKSGRTMQVILQAAWVRVLSAYLGEDSVVFGVVLSGRNTEATRNALFPCITTLPVIASNKDSNGELLTDMLRYNTALFKQQHQPLTRIQQWLGCPDARLFDTLLVYQKSDQEEPQQRLWNVVDENPNIDYPVSMEVEPTDEGWLGYQVTFFSDVLPEQQASLLLDQFDAAVQHLALQPDGDEADLCPSNLGLYSVLPPETAELSAEVEFLHQFVELQAAKVPNATALHFVESFQGEDPVGSRWTYEELNDKGNAVAQLLLPHVDTGDIVAVYFDKCPEAYLSILGILKAGCAFVALDPSAPASRNEFILQDSGASVVLTSPERKDTFGSTLSYPVIVITKHTLAFAPAGPPILSRELRPDDACYCLYTSGTTGTPKGCLITHDNAVQCMLAFRHIFRGHWEEDSKWLQFASLHFDVSVLEQYWTWSVGITLVAAPRDLILEDLAGTISRLGITHIDLTPSLARLLHPDDVPSLCRGVFITGGEPLRQEILDVWGSKAVIYNFYGPTEATIGVTVFPRVPTSGRASNIGQQFINVGSYVLKPGTEQPVLKGGVGELCVSGPLVGKGYLKRDDLTAEKFPTLQHFGERVYRTGDLVRVLYDGCFDFLGRADDQVKLRGQRLEVGEINHVIRKRVEAVRDIATLVVRNSAQEKDVLVSFIVSDHVARRTEDFDRLELVQTAEAAQLSRAAKDACRATLPGYMVPTYVLQLPFIPLSVNNKAELKQLRKFFASLDPEKLLSFASSTSQARGELNATGLMIARVLSSMEAVDAASITPESSIYELGVDSISVLRFSRALRNEGLNHASPFLILRYPLVGDLADALDAQKVAPTSDSVTAAKQLVLACAHEHRPLVCRELGVTAEQIEYVAPCSPLQQGMISRSATDDAYFNTFRFVLAPAVSTELLRQAVQHVVDVMPILRTKFVGTADGYVQVALKQLTLPWTDAQLGNETATERAIEKSRDNWVARNQELFSQPLEAMLIESPGARLLILHIFHGLYDGNSFDLVLNRVATEYLALGSGSTEEAHGVESPSFLEALCHGPLQEFSSSKSFWLRHLEGAEAVHSASASEKLPVTSSRREVPFGHLETRRTRLGVTHQALVQAAWVAILADHFLANPTIGIIFSGRGIALDGAENVIGPLFNTLPFHARIAGDNGQATWASLIRQCHAFNTDVLPFQHVALRDIQKWCSGGRALFDTLFTFQREDGPAAGHENLWTMLESEPNADYPLALEATLDASGCLHLLLVARGSSKDELEAMMSRLEQALSAMAETENVVRGLGTAQANRSTRNVVANGHVTNGATEHGAATNGVTTNGHLGNEDESFAWTEQAILIRSEVAGLADVDPQVVSETTPLFGLGLDSIDLIKLSARLKRLGIAVKTSELMRLQTVKAIVGHIDADARNGQAHGVNGESVKREEAQIISALRQHLADNVDDDEIVLPATALQESMVVDMVQSDFELYFNHDILELAPSVSIPKLKEAWLTVTAGSPILRTRFLPVETASIESTYCQVIGKEPTVHITDVSLSSMEELDKVCNTATLRARKGAGQSNLLQLQFASVGDQRFLVLSIAHALYDGWSLDLIHDHVRAAYEGRYEAQSLQSYLGQLQGILFPEHRSARNFWSGYLQDARPTMFPEGETGSGQRDVVYRDEIVSSLAASEITAFCKANAVTLQTLGQACWAALLAAETGSLDVTFGVVLSCRDTESLEELVFPTMNTVAVRSVLHGTVSSWLRYMQDHAASISVHQQFPLREAQKLAENRGPLFNTLFIQQRSTSASRQENEKLMQSMGGTSAVEYPVCVEVEVDGSKLVWRIACDGAYASRDKTSATLLDLDEILRHLTRSSEADVFTSQADKLSICGQQPIQLRTLKKSAKESVSRSPADQHAPWSPLEETIRDVLAEVSGVPPARILRSNSIYHLGLDSISAIKVGILLRKKGVTIGFRDMLKAESIPEMARSVRAGVSLADSAETKPVDEVDVLAGTLASTIRDTVPTILQDSGIEESAVEAMLPASPVQVHMLSVWQNTGGEVFYPSFTYQLTGQIDISSIKAAWNTLVAELPILRTVFVSTGSQSCPVLQIVLGPPAVEQGQSSPDGKQWSSRAPDVLRQPYNSLRAEKNGDKWTLRLRMHHALYDAISLPAMMQRFAALCSRGPAPAPAKPPAFDWSSALRRPYSDGAQQARKRFWTDYLAGASSTPLRLTQAQGQPTQTQPQTQPQTRHPHTRVQTIRESLLKDTLPALLSTCKSHGISIQSLFFAAHAELLASSATARGLPRPRHVVFGVYLANRAERHDAGAAFYPFLRLVPLRVVLSERVDLVGVARAVQADLHSVSAPGNVEVGLWEVRDWTGVVVDSFVNFLGAVEEVGEGGEGCLQVVVADVGVSGESGEEERGLGVGSIPVRDAFPNAVDVEVSLQDDGMTIGVFGPRETLGEDGAPRVIEELVGLLKSFV